MPKEIKSRLPRVSAAQTEVLCTFFEENPEVIRGYKKTTKGKELVQNKWKKITQHLNSLGTQREPNAWAKYICDVKAKLKRKDIKWRQNSDGTGPVICNAADFDEIKLRMLQVLMQNPRESQESHVSNTSHLEMEEDTKDEQDDDSNSGFGMFPSEDTKIGMKIEHNPKPVYIKLRSNDTPPPEANARAVYLGNEIGDEFDTFGKNVVQQLRTMPLAVAIKTQEILLSVLCKQRLSVNSHVH